MLLPPETYLTTIIRPPSGPPPIPQTWVNSRGVLVRIAPAGDVFDNDHQTTARAAAHPTDVG